MKPKITVFSLSLRTDSVSSKLAKLAQNNFKIREIESTILDANDLKSIPLFSEEFKPTDDYHRIGNIIKNSDIIVFSTPVYCTSVSAATKNILDTFCSQLRNKWFAVFCAVGSPRAQYAAKDFLTSLAMETQSIVIPTVICASEDELAQDEDKIITRIDHICALLLEGAENLPTPFRKKIAQ